MQEHYLVFFRAAEASIYRCIGKASNSLASVEEGLMHSEQNVYTEHADPKRDEWTTKILPVLKNFRLGVPVKMCRGLLSRRAIIDLRAGRSRPHPRNRKFLESIIQSRACV